MIIFYCVLITPNFELKKKKPWDMAYIFPNTKCDKSRFTSVGCRRHTFYLFIFFNLYLVSVDIQMNIFAKKTTLKKLFVLITWLPLYYVYWKYWSQNARMSYAKISSSEISGFSLEYLEFPLNNFTNKSCVRGI